MSDSNTLVHPLDLEVRHLRLVLAVATEGNLTRAGERLHLTQSALSHQLLDIEERLGTALFHRVGRKMVLTQAGERILEAARRVLGDLHRTEDDVRRISGGRAGVIRLTTECYTCYHWLPRILSPFREKHPQIEVRIDVESTRRPFEALREGTIELAIVSSSTSDPRIAIRPGFADEYVLIFGENHRFARREFVEARDIADEHLLVYEGVERSTIVQQVLRPEGLEPKEVTAVPLTEATIELVRAGLGVAGMARWAAEPFVERGLVHSVPIGRKGIHREWNIAHLEGPLPEHVEDFIEIVRVHGPKAAGAGCVALVDPSASKRIA